MNNKSESAKHITAQIETDAKMSIVAPEVIPKVVPAVKVALHGQHLIEASAGTGKTWTLTGIVLRLLIEAKRAPEHIIATTFTRAAAAEMRERIHARLVDFYQLLQWLNKLQANRDNYPILYPQFEGVVNKSDSSANNNNTHQNSNSNNSAKKITTAQRQARQLWLEQQATLAGTVELISDPINSHLLAYLLDHTTDYPLADAMRRCALVLTTLDKLFVGTLDSLSQKWLSEYSAETGYQQGMQISADEQIIIESIIHDAVRGFHSQMYYQQPEIYKLLQHSKRLSKPSDHLNVATKSLQFISTPINNVELGEPIDFSAYQQALDSFAKCDLKDVEPYLNFEYRTAQGFGKAGKIGKSIGSIFTIQQAISQYGVVFFTQLDSQANVLYTELSAAFISKDDGGNVFNKGKEAERLAFINLKSIQALKVLCDCTDRITLYLDGLIEILNRNIALQVRQKLPSILESRRETTFALQMVRLNQALSGQQGERLARYIRHHYPIALIDESQDINGEQAQMLERIYLAKDLTKDKDDKSSHRGFLLLVGDPKQAIYGFRGGDVANYNAMKARFNPKQIMSLDINRRSNDRLINALNHWFGRSEPVKDNNDDSNDADSNGADQLAQLGKGIYYRYITAANTDTHLSWHKRLDETTDKLSVDGTQHIAILPINPVSIIHLPYDKAAKYNANELTALHIAALLASQQTIEGRAIKPSDIGVLGRRKHDLKQVEQMLAKLNVPTLETAENNVFDTVIGTDLAALLEAMLRPHRRDIINRVLTSHFYQLSLNEVKQLMHSIEQEESLTSDNDSSSTEADRLRQRYQHFQDYLKRGAHYWQNNGILSALHYLFSYNPLIAQGSGDNLNQSTQHNSIWVALSGLSDGARHLMDLRQLMDILAQHGMQSGEHELLAWYQKSRHSKHTPEWAQQQPLPTESGVQLMTIHKSKGLEFPIVYVVGMDTASPKAGTRNKHNLFLYDHNCAVDEKETGIKQSTLRRLSASKALPPSKSVKADTDKDYYAQFETTENYEEIRRLAYVAFTRASEQLYIVLNDSSRNMDNHLKPSIQWLEGSDKSFILPERLQDHIGWLEYKAIETNAEAIIAADKAVNRSAEKSVESDDKALERINYEHAYAQIKQHAFKGWAKTSFTALSRQLGEQAKALAVFDDGIEDELDLTDGINLATSTHVIADKDNKFSADNIRFRFVKGANAGTFLHEIFEKIDFNNPSKWSDTIDHAIRQYQLPISYTSAHNQQRLLDNNRLTTIVSTDMINAQNDKNSGVLENIQAPDHDELIDWIADVLSAPLRASGQTLQSIPVNQRIAELGFNMGLAADFMPEHINEVFAQYLPDEPDKQINLESQYASHVYRYLRGEIDLVYEYAGKYYVVDYKSNYLGNSLSNYNDENINTAMNKAGYWLQAAIYQVALHRFLRLRIADYTGHETQYLGAVEYVFLRGIDSQGQHNYGRIHWEIPFALVQALDEMFGLPTR